MVDNHFKDNPDWMSHDMLDARVLDIMRQIPRHKFVASTQSALAYKNHPLPIGFGQTISQPLIVAIMTSVLELKPNDRVLEIGTGSGYQTAILSVLVKQVYSIEVIPPLQSAAKKRLNALGFHNISYSCKDGHTGWAEHAPFDAIIVSAAVATLPDPLVEQLKEGGNMVLPIGEQNSVQQLCLVNKNESGAIVINTLLPVSFVPFVDQ